MESFLRALVSNALVPEDPSPKGQETQPIAASPSGRSFLYNITSETLYLAEQMVSWLDGSSRRGRR